MLFINATVVTPFSGLGYGIIETQVHASFVTFRMYPWISHLIFLSLCLVLCVTGYSYTTCRNVTGGWVDRTWNPALCLTFKRATFLFLLFSNSLMFLILWIPKSSWTPNNVHHLPSARSMRCWANIPCDSVQFSHSVVSNSLQPHGMLMPAFPVQQQTGRPCWEFLLSHYMAEHTAISRKTHNTNS